MIEAVGSALFEELYPPEPGRQDLGQSPGGAIDQFSTAIAKILLNSSTVRSYSFIFGRELVVKEDSFLFVTGAKYKEIRCNDKTIQMNAVCRVPANTSITFAKKLVGFRTYIFAVPDTGQVNPAGRKRGSYQNVFNWADANGAIRLLPGPEASILKDIGVLEGEWKIGAQSNAMGLRLERSGFEVSKDMLSMISQPVADGTIQLTAEGPIVLLRKRQTIGGYPRVANVISADVDLLAQYGPGDSIRFTVVAQKEATEMFEKKQQILKRDVIPSG